MKKAKFVPELNDIHLTHFPPTISESATRFFRQQYYNALVMQSRDMGAFQRLRELICCILGHRMTYRLAGMFIENGVILSNSCCSRCDMKVDSGALIFPNGLRRDVIDIKEVTDDVDEFLKTVFSPQEDAD